MQEKSFVVCLGWLAN